MPANEAVYRTTVVTFRDEHNPHGPVMMAPPPVPCSVTRAEVVVTPSQVVVHVWLAAEPAERTDVLSERQQEER